MSLYHRSYGSGPPLLILHGLFGSMDNWATLARRWGRHFRVLTTDARNHGHSFHDPVMTYSAMADDIERFMDEQSLATASILGHSMGGKTAMQFSLTRPERVDRLIAVDICPRAYNRRENGVLAALRALRPEAFESRAEADKALSASIEDQAVRQYLLKNLARSDHGGFRWKLNLDAIASGHEDLHAGIPDSPPFRGPALFVRGGKSGYVSDADRHRIMELFPHAIIHTIEKAGHWVHSDAPDELEKVVTDFLSSDLR